MKLFYVKAIETRDYAAHYTIKAEDRAAASQMVKSGTVRPHTTTLLDVVETIVEEVIEVDENDFQI